MPAFPENQPSTAGPLGTELMSAAAGQLSKGPPLTNDAAARQQWADIKRVFSRRSEPIREARRQTAEEIEHWLQWHVYAAPDRRLVTMPFDDWAKFRRMLKRKYGARIPVE